MPVEQQLSREEVEEMREEPMVAENLEMEDEDELPIFGDNLKDIESHNPNYPVAIEDLSDDEREDYYIKDSDSLIVAGKVEKEFASLEVYIFEHQTNNLFVHHEIMLSSFPLDIAWLKVGLSSLHSQNPSKGNYAIVSSFQPEIQIWNLDLTEAIEPDVALGGQLLQKSRKVKKFTNHDKKFKKGSHLDSVLTLSLNQLNLAVLASGSADAAVKIWDIAKQQCIHTADHHTSRVNKVQWSPKDHSVIFACSQDKRISIMDSRYPDDRIFHNIIKNQQLQSATWNSNNETEIAYVTNHGNLCLIDVRMQDKILKQQHCHNGRINDIKIGRKNLCFTCSEDQNVRIWDLNNLQQPLASKNPKCGTLFCLDLMQEKEGPMLSAGNAKGELFVWDITENKEVAQHWNTK